jgi:hypothetical protein
LKRRNVKGWKAMKAQCATCPFRNDPELAARVLDRTLFKAAQICHHPTLHGKPQTHLCRGARDVQLQCLYRMGLIDAPSDNAFERKSRELGVIA